MLVLYHSGRKSACFWCIFTDSEMSMMINCTALRFCCGAYLCGPNSETNKCVMPCRRQIAKLSYNQVIHSLCWTEYFRNLFVIQIFYHWEGGWFLILKWACITILGHILDTIWWEFKEFRKVYCKSQKCSHSVISLESILKHYQIYERRFMYKDDQPSII
jgi:hypothetical protein